MSSESKKRKVTKFPTKGKDKFLSNRRSSRGSGGYNSSKRQNVKKSADKEIETELSAKNEVVRFSEFILENIDNESEFTALDSFKSFDEIKSELKSLCDDNWDEKSFLAKAILLLDEKYSKSTL
jgi:hypothetical protein